MGNLVAIPKRFLEPKSVKVLGTDGKVQTYSGCHLVTVAHVLESYPQHCLAKAGQERTIRRGLMLRDEEVLKPGTTYVVRPLPRIFSVSSKSRSQGSFSSKFSFRMAPGGFSVSDPLSDDQDNGQLHRNDVEPPAPAPASLIAMEKSLEEINNPLMKGTWSSSGPTGAPTLTLSNFFKNAGIEWKEINRTWRPELDSIQEESMKLLQHRKSFAELTESEQFLAVLRKAEKSRRERG